MLGSLKNDQSVNLFSVPRNDGDILMFAQKRKLKKTYDMTHKTWPNKIRHTNTSTQKGNNMDMTHNRRHSSTQIMY